MPSLRSTLGAAALLIGVTALVLTTREGAPGRPGAVAALERSEAVIDAKIARKTGRIAEGGKRPDSPDKAAEYRRLQRTSHGGEIPLNALVDAKRQVESMMPRGRDAGIWNWTWLGPGNVGGRIRTILVHPTIHSTMWVGSASGGIWKTTNSGGAWTPLSDFLASLAVTQLVMDPTDSDVIYASTGEGFGNLDGLPGAGIFKSTNGGTTWNQLSATVDSNAPYVNDIAIHPTAGSTLYAATGTQSGVGNVWRTTNGGTSWNKNVLATPKFATDVKIDPDNPQVVFVGTGGGAWRSTDGGGTWDEMTDGGGSSLPDSTGRIDFHAPAGSDYVYASVALGSGRLYRSLDNGATWTLRSTVGVLGGQGWYDNVVWCEDAFPNSVMWGGIDLWRSLNGGSSFTRMSSWDLYHTGTSAHADQHAIVPHPDYDPPNNMTIFFGNDGGIQKTTQGFLTTIINGWGNLANGLGITQFYRADVTPAGTMIVGGTQDNSDLRLTNGGTNGWYQAITGDGGCCLISPSDSNFVYVSKQYLLVMGSDNAGATYSERIIGLGDADNASLSLFVAPLEMDKNAPFVLYAGGTTVWESRDGAHTWHSFFDPVAGNKKCSSISVGPQLVGPESADLWFGYEDGQIYATADRGVTWADRSPGLPNRYITDIEVSPHDRELALVCLGGYEPDGVWITTDGGASWDDATGTAPYGLPDVQPNCVSFHPSNPNWIYCGTDIGLFASEDRGQTWNVTSRYGDSEGPVFTEVADIIWHSDSRLIAVTHGRGMYECTPLDVVFVDSSNSGPEDGTWGDPWSTVGEGLDAIGPGATLSINAGTYSAGPRTITRRTTLTSNGGTAVIQ